MFDFNNPEVRGVLLELSNEIGSHIQIIPIPFQTGEKIPNDYQFSEADLIGTIDKSITVDLVNKRIEDNRWRRVRWDRDQKLKETDVWAMTDRTMSQAQIDYRQALRDITTQEDPRNIIWPQKPENN